MATKGGDRRVPPWLAGGRPQRPSHERRLQLRRHNGRLLQGMLKCLTALDEHRGCRRSKLGEAFYQALRTNGGSTAGDVVQSNLPAGTADDVVQSNLLVGTAGDVVHRNLHVSAADDDACELPLRREDAVHATIVKLERLRMELSEVQQYLQNDRGAASGAMQPTALQADAVVPGNLHVSTADVVV